MRSAVLRMVNVQVALAAEPVSVAPRFVRSERLPARKQLKLTRLSALVAALARPPVSTERFQWFNFKL